MLSLFGLLVNVSLSIYNWLKCKHREIVSELYLRVVVVVVAIVRGEGFALLLLLVEDFGFSVLGDPVA